MHWFLFCILFITQTTFAFSCADKRPIIQKPIIFNEERIQLTRDYQRKHYGITTKSIEIEPKIIVLHWTDFPTLTQSFAAFYSPRLSSARPELPDKLNVSIHYLVDRDGTIYQLMPDHWMARHVIGLNHYAIGIENVGGVDDEADLTQAQVKSNAFLVCYLKKKYPSIQYLIGHMDYLKFKDTPLWLEQEANYQTDKSDPGKDFMHKVRELTQSLDLQAAP